MMKKRIATLVASLAISSAAMAANWQSLPDKAPEPADNKATPEKIELGKALYFDPRLSVTGTVSCNSCHNVMAGGDDNRDFSMGVFGKQGGRSAPTVWNSAFNGAQFWDGRAPTLEEQAKGPMLADVEMGMSSHDVVIERIKQAPGYVSQFEKVFGKKGLNIENAVKAIAAYERTLITPNSAFDRYIEGDSKAMTKEQIAGMQLFEKTGCVACHNGPAFNGMASGTQMFAKFPTFENSPYVAQYDFMKDKGKNDAHLFKVPTLRNIALTAPYFSNGSVTTLKEAVKVMASTQLNKTLSDKEADQLVAFLNALTGEFPTQTMPRLPATAGTTLLK